MMFFPSNSQTKTLNGSNIQLQEISHFQDVIILLVKFQKDKCLFLEDFMNPIEGLMILIFLKQGLKWSGLSRQIKNLVKFLKIQRVRLEHLNQEPIIQLFILKILIRYSFLEDMEDQDIQGNLLMIYMNQIVKVLNGKKLNLREVHQKLEEDIYLELCQIQIICLFKGVGVVYLNIQICMFLNMPKMYGVKLI